ncbi:MAG TPA: hypothetical protein VH988_08465 [Thermoanaerobaculia bacterium]|jgi:hypothetical protein|nr:hypothetical protein [Thermoanaerobaculia bacterium]
MSMTDVGGPRERPTNAFRNEFLDLLREQDEPVLSMEGETTGPWELRREPDGWALYRMWEGAEHGDIPEAAFKYRDVGLLFLAVWPAVGRDPVFRLAAERDRTGFEVESGAAPVGGLRTFNDELLHAAHVAACVVRSPLGLAALFEAAGPIVQDKVGQILGRRMEKGRTAASE